MICSLRDRVQKNKQFFDNLNINVCENASDAPGGENSTGEQLRNCSLIERFQYRGLTVRPILNNDKKEIFVRTGIRIFGIHRNFSNSKVSSILYHELGHLFDMTFGNRNEKLENDLRQHDENLPISDEEWEKIRIIDETTDLSDTNEFKKAWQIDANKIGKSYTSKEIKELGYFAPNFQSEIKIDDGVDIKEVDAANNDRCEILAQLFAYALGEDGNDEVNAEKIKKAYSNVYEVVKKYINKYFNIELNLPPWFRNYNFGNNFAE